MKRIIRFAKDDAEAENWIATERNEYDRETHLITEKITSLVHKTYTFEEFNDIAAARGWMGEFGAYEF